jgi:putative Ca2+/H+ antiporter (TMEM165/GDT1 family)
MHTLDLAIIAAVFPVIFIGELPDKSMFASLVMASRGHPFLVWLGTALAFLVHVVIAVSIGVSLFRILPQEVVDVVVAILFGVGAVVAFIAAFDAEERQEEIITEYRAHRVFATAFLVIFVAEWGDLTQVLTANFAVRYGSGLSVAVGATLALWTVSGLAVLGGYGLLARLPARGLRLATGSVLAVLSVLALVAAFR